MLARLADAPKYAADSFQKATDALAWAERNQSEKPGQKPAITMAREAVVRAEDARVIAIRAERQESLDQERQASRDRETAARATAEAERSRADADRAAAEVVRSQAQAATLQAQAASQDAARERQRAEDARLDADRVRQQSLDEQQKLTAQADQARETAARSQQEQMELRSRLMLQLNQILETRETARGLIVSMSDVLFDTGQDTLKPGAREKLAKVSGIILAHPGLKIDVEGHTDSVGTEDFNMTLSENRAKSVRDYLVSQGITSAVITARGFGKSQPVADNGTAAGRQQNRRVELVVSGEVMGARLDAAPVGTIGR
jgi:outer membrane protein OmpA-like peptidoglycan-associated protein